MTQGLYYLAIPYDGTEEQKAYRQSFSLKAAGEFLKQGIHTFAPVIYMNVIADSLNLSTQEERRRILLPYLLEFLQLSKGLILVTAEGWRQSWGVGQELKYCETHHIPVYILNPNQLEGELNSIFKTPLKAGDMIESN